MTQQTNSCSKSTIATLEKGVEYVQSLHRHLGELPINTCLCSEVFCKRGDMRLKLPPKPATLPKNDSIAGVLQ